MKIKLISLTVIHNHVYMTVNVIPSLQMRFPYDSITSSHRLQRFGKITQANICIAVEILTVEMYTQTFETFSLLKHQSNSINSRITLLDLL